MDKSHSNQTGMIKLKMLLKDIFVEIFKFLPLEDALTCSQVSKTWYAGIACYSSPHFSLGRPLLEWWLDRTVIPGLTSDWQNSSVELLSQLIQLRKLPLTEFEQVFTRLSQLVTDEANELTWLNYGICDFLNFWLSWYCCVEHDSLKLQVAMESLLICHRNHRTEDLEFPVHLISKSFPKLESIQRMLQRDEKRSLQVEELIIMTAEESVLPFTDISVYLDLSTIPMEGIQLHYSCLTEVHLDHCGLQRFPWWVLKNQPLTYLSLQGNPLDLSKEPPEELQLVPRNQPIALSMADCQLTYLPAWLWNILDYWFRVDLDISNNLLQGSFECEEMISCLQIQGNQVTHLTGGWLDSPTYSFKRTQGPLYDEIVVILPTGQEHNKRTILCDSNVVTAVSNITTVKMHPPEWKLEPLELTHDFPRLFRRILTGLAD